MYVQFKMPLRHETPKMPPLNDTATSGIKPLPISVAIDPVALITTECITVTSAMRKHARWAHSSVAAILGGGTASLSPMPSISRNNSQNGLAMRTQDDAAVVNRWGSRGQRGKSLKDNPLMAGFGRLRSDLAGCKGTFFPWPNEAES